MFCGRPSSSRRKSLLVRSRTISPFLLRTLANRLTTLTPEENFAVSWSGDGGGGGGADCCCPRSKPSEGMSPRVASRVRRVIECSEAIGVFIDARCARQVTSLARLLPKLPPRTRARVAFQQPQVLPALHGGGGEAVSIGREAQPRLVGGAAGDDERARVLRDLANRSAGKIDGFHERSGLFPAGGVQRFAMARESDGGTVQLGQGAALRAIRGKELDAVAGFTGQPLAGGGPFQRHETGGSACNDLGLLIGADSDDGRLPGAVAMHQSCDRVPIRRPSGRHHVF